MLHQIEKLVLSSLRDGSKTLEELTELAGVSRDSIRRAGYWLKEKGAVEVHESKAEEFQLGAEGKRFLEHDFPEFNLLKKLRQGKGFEEIGEEEELGLLQTPART